MSVSMLDSATPPTAAQAAQLRAAGHQVWAGYLPPSAGWSSAAWAPSDFGTVRAAGFAVAGVIFGPDATHALDAAHRYGVGTVVLDVESNDPGYYAPSWGDALRGLVRTVLYGLPAVCSRYGAHFDAVWVAERSAGPPATVAPRQAVQWLGSHVLAGVNVDESLADDWYLGDAMDPQQKSALIRNSAYTLLGRQSIDAASWDGWHNDLATVNDPDAIVAFFADSQEAVNYRSRVSAACAGAGAPTGAVPAHTHPISLTGATG